MGHLFECQYEQLDAVTWSDRTTRSCKLSVQVAIEAPWRTCLVLDSLLVALCRHMPHIYSLVMLLFFMLLFQLLALGLSACQAVCATAARIVRPTI